jgi:hypothetical protein
MGFERRLMPGFVSTALLLAAAPVGAHEAKEPLIITQIPDAEPGFVRAGEAKLVITRSAASDETPSIDDAMASFGRAIGQAIGIEQQAIQAACKSGEAPKAGTPAAYEWRARCSYVRR